MMIECDGVKIDVVAFYERHKVPLPPTPTMSAWQIREEAGRPDSYQVWHGMTPLKDAEAVALIDGMVFTCVPPATY